MASTRSSSPAGDVSAPTSPQLTPRSKIKALLATVNDADSDDESSVPILPKSLFKSNDKDSTSNTELHTTQNAEEDDEEEEIFRPRGRLAARMRASDTNTVDKPTQSHTTSADSHEENGQSAHASDDDEQEISAPRRRLARPARPSTPEVTADTETPPSPGLFVTPAPETPIGHRQSAADSDTDDELPVDLGKNERFQALVARKRQERLAKEAEEDRKRKERAERMAEQMPAESDVDEDVSDITDDDGGRKLTQEVSRPARKASKKALEEMNRETQRLSRSLQLAHEAKTKKKISKSALFERFNFRTEAAPADKQTSSSRPTTPGSAQHTDAEMVDAGTPPSSPPAAPKPAEDLPTTSETLNIATKLTAILEENDSELPSLEEVVAQSQKEDKGKGKAVEALTAAVETKGPAITKPKRQIRVKLPPMHTNLVTIDSDEELEIIQPKKGRMDAIFDNLPERKAQESRSMNVLRRLAHLSSPSKESRGCSAKPSMTPAELQMSLQQRARAQAKLERERRLEYLKSKGITVQTEEERQREREQVEDIVARARQEVEEIMQREREDAKKARKEKRKNGEADPLAWDDSDDDSFEDTEEEQAEIELSGSGEEEDGEEDEDMDDAEDEGEESVANPMVMDEADEDEESGEEHTPKATTNVPSDDEADDELPPMKSRRPKKRVHIVSDDEDGDEVEATPRPKANYPKSPSVANPGSPKIPTSVLRSATKTFIPGLPVPLAKPAGLGLTQIFAGTMDDSQFGPGSGSPQEFMPTVEDFPDSQFSAKAGQSQNDMVLDSQPTQNVDTQGRETQTQGVQLHFTQSQAHGFDTLMQMQGTQMSEFIEPTQDGGFQAFSPLKQRFIDAPQSTVDTVLMRATPDYEKVQESPLVKRTGRLRRRVESSLSFSTSATADIQEVPGSPSTAPSAPKATEVDAGAAASAFRLMEKAARRKKRMQEKFDKKKSKANEMVEEQAEESEDEYAGLGGADGEDSSEEDEELVKEMIDDAAGNNGDEAKLAGFFADRERAADQAQVDKLFHDITTGMLRKRRRGGAGNNDFDLSDSDDGGEARRRMKRRQFAKMQKALFADERIGKIAENPRNAAFLKSIEDRNSDDEWDFGENFADTATNSAEGESQSQGHGQNTPAAEEQSIPDSQPPTNEEQGRKRPHADEHAARPPPNARRTKGGARPSSLTDVRRELSNLLDEPNGSAASIIPATEVGSDSENEDRPSTAASNKENQRPEIVDRIKLKRDSSSLSATGSTSGARPAFAAPERSNSGGFRVPALLRRATTNSLFSNSSSSGTSTPVSTTAGGIGSGTSLSSHKSGLTEDSKILKKTAGKRSGVNYFARENERRAAVADAEKRREARKWKGAEGRSKVVGGLFGGGKFE